MDLKHQLSFNNVAPGLHAFGVLDHALTSVLGVVAEVGNVNAVTFGFAIVSGSTSQYSGHPCTAVGSWCRVFT